MPRFRFFLGIGYANANQEEIVEISDDELEGLDAAAREKYIEEQLQDWANNYIDMGFEEVGEDETE